MPMYTSYRQQYTFGQIPMDLTALDTTTPSPSYYGSNSGGQAAIDDGTHGDVSGYTMPIDLKADEQMFALKARLDVKVLTTLAGSGAVAKVSLHTCGAASGYPNKPDTANAVEILSFNVSTAGTPAASSIPFFEITMPSNCKRWVFVKVVLADKTKAFSAGKLLMHFNPNL